jgi:hypothetical protein
MNKKILPLVVLLLVLVNAVLLFLLVKPKEEMSMGPQKAPGDRIATALDFTEEQMAALEPFSEKHHQRMRGIDRELNQTRQLFFREFNAETKRAADSLLQQIGELNKEREAEVFHFMQQVQSLCTDAQQAQMKRMMRRALPPPPPGSNRLGPPPGGDRPERAQGHRPPPPRNEN